MNKLAVLLGFVAVQGQLTGNQTCQSTGQITHFDWDVLMSDIDEKPAMTYSMDIDQASLSLVIEAELEYVGYAYADDHTYGFGTTYVLDFEDYDAESDDIREPGNCQNRVSTHFSGSWTGLWQYSHTPAVDNHLANESTLAYPPSGDRWDLTIDNDCTPIKYRGEFTWAQLRGCGNYDADTEYTRVATDDNWINLTGVFYINLVSPLAHYTDTGYYRVYQMLSAPFVIAVRNQINIISSVGINLFTLTIIAVYKEDLENDFRLIVLTESADFLMLSEPVLLSTPTLNPNTINFRMLNESINDGCLTASANLCSQLWEIYANDVTCPPMNFTGDYALEFTTTCNPDADSIYANGSALCDNYITTYGSEVGLTASLDWLDTVCDPEVFIIQFTGTMTFHNDSTFEHELGDGDQYALGDTAYVQVSIDMPQNAYSIFGIKLTNVWVCTTSPDNEPLVVDDPSFGTGGCLGSGIDAGFPWHIVISGEENDLYVPNDGEVTLYQPLNSSASNSSLGFSFFLDSSISRVNLYVQAQVTITLLEEEGGRRRRARALLQSDNTAQQMRHFEGVTGVRYVILVPEDDVDIKESKGTELSLMQELKYPLIVGAVMMAAFFVFCGIGFYFYKKKLDEHHAALMAQLTDMVKNKTDDGKVRQSIDIKIDDVAPIHDQTEGVNTINATYTNVAPTSPPTPFDPVTPSISTANFVAKYESTQIR